MLDPLVLDEVEDRDELIVSQEEVLPDIDEARVKSQVSTDFHMKAI